MLSLGKLLELTLVGREPAQKTQMTVGGTRLRWLAPGVLEASPSPARDSGLDLLLSAGVHGNETAPIEVLDNLLHAIARGELHLRARVLFVLGNPDALRTGVRYVEQDLNRLFNGQHEISSGAEAMRAGELERLVSSFFSETGRQRLHYDLYSSARPSRYQRFAVLPWQEGRTQSPGQLARLASMAITALLLQRAAGTTFTAFTYQTLAAEAFTLELGRGAGLEVVEQGIRALITGEAELPGLAPETAFAVFRVARSIIKHSDEFRLQLPPTVEHFSQVPRGTLLALDGNKRWLVEEDNAHIVFPSSRVATGQPAGVLAVPGQLD